jgi:CDP-6-deoxy-D-xylo-4-hexulose-3-dehydrase
MNQCTRTGNRHPALKMGPKLNLKPYVAGSVSAVEERNILFPLVDSSYDNKEILSAISTLLSGQLTMGPQVKDFEKKFSDFLNSPYAVMTNSGSSANLLVFSVLTNPLRTKHLKANSKVAIPAICWPTSLWPIVQTGLIPVLIDVDAETLNMSIDSLRLALKKHKIEAVMMVHVLGNSTAMDDLLKLVEEYNLILIEDTCESLGSKYKSDYLGTIGDFGTFSFYFSHHMTTIEGGMIVARNREDADLLKCIRAHGWTRELSNRSELESRYNQIDPRFLFVNIGYNLRPMEIQAAFGLEQVKRLEEMNKSRRANFNNLRKAFLSHQLWENQLVFPSTPENISPCWFGFPFLISPNLNIDRKTLIAQLLTRGIDTRPIVSGNMAIQPATKLFNVDLSMGPFVGAQEVHERGIFIGCHSKLLSRERINLLVSTILESLDETLK